MHSVSTAIRACCAKGTKCESPGQRPGNLRNERPEPPKARNDRVLINPFQGFHVRYYRFLGRCPRLSHCAALRQTAPATRSVLMEQNPHTRMPTRIRLSRRPAHPAIEFFPLSRLVRHKGRVLLQFHGRESCLRAGFVVPNDKDHSFSQVCSFRVRHVRPF